MDFAVIETGGKQYLVKEGTNITIEKLAGDFKSGETISFDKVILTSKKGELSLGAPYLEGVKVDATFESNGRGAKVLVVKYKAKSRYLKRNGHRQPNSKLTVKKIV